VAEVRRASDGLNGRAEFQTRAGSERTVTIALEFPVNASLRAEPAGSAPAGSRVAVSWEGPDRDGDFVTVVAPGDTSTAYNDYAYTKDGNPLSIRMPVDPGDYELRYVLGRPPRVLARLPIAATAVSASIEAPAHVDAGSPFSISWTGPNDTGDWLTVIAPDAGPTAYASYVNADSPSPGTLNAPLQPGDYELRYVVAGKNVLARRPITVGAVTASIEAVAEVAAGSRFRIAWTGPNNHGDWLTVIGTQAGPQAYASYVDADAGGEPWLTAPLEPGDYELRYVAGGREVIARTPIKVTAVSASIEAPDQVAAGSAFTIRWQGPNNNGDWLTIVTPDTGPSGYASYWDADGGTPGTLNAPAEPGDYEIRYVQAGKVVLARKPIRVNVP
jgi:Ca-activated chloride channel family protein